MKLQRLGVHTGFWQNARENETPSCATRRSIAGVTAAALPTWPSTSPRHWSGLNMMMSGRSPAARSMLRFIGHKVAESAHPARAGQ